MGCFDTIVFRCPECNEFINEQTKAGDCTLTRYFFDDAPIEILASLDGRLIPCEKCGYTARIKVLRPQVVVI